MKKTILALFLGSAMYFSCQRPADDSVARAEELTEERLEGEDADLLDNAETMIEVANNQMLVLELSERAQDRAVNENVQKYAEWVHSEQEELYNDLQEVAQNRNIALPIQPGDNNLETMSDVMDAEGEDFDIEYLDAIVNATSDLENDLEDLAENSEDAEIRSWANDALVKVRKHNEKGERLQDKVDDSTIWDDIFGGDDRGTEGQEQDMEDQDDDSGIFQDDQDGDMEDDNDGIFDGDNENNQDEDLDDNGTQQQDRGTQDGTGSGGNN
jgi:putative membrane protein